MIRMLRLFAMKLKRSPITSLRSILFFHFF